jgi:hypothetical protein
MWGKNLKKVKRKEEDKRRKMEKNGEKLNKEDYFIYRYFTCVRVTNLIMSVPVRKYNKITSFFLHYSNV